MFQYAGLRGIAKQNGYDWVVPPPDSYGDSNYGLFDCFEMSTVSENNFGYLQGVQNVATGCFHFSENFFNQCPDNVNIHDYFQTEKYFKNAEKIIRKDYTFKKEIVDAVKGVVDEYENPIFLHVRRGDYVKQPENHPVCPISYYEKALKEFPEDTPVFVFSDDLDWCREHFTDDRFMMPEENLMYNHTADTNDGRIKTYVPYYDLCMMSLCSGAIIANSSMSWWGAYLQNGRGKVVAPKPWFGTRYKDYDMSDLLPESWIELEV